ncbi:hypothetical protein MTO96_034258 [Rhipicephalus appendiculatus]
MDPAVRTPGPTVKTKRMEPGRRCSLCGRKKLLQKKRPNQWISRGPRTTNKLPLLKQPGNLNIGQPTGGYPPLPKDDFKIVVRPHQGLPVKNLTSPLLADAVIAACSGQISGEQFLLRIKPGSNIFIVSTPHQTVADHVRRITKLSINGRPHSVNAYVATSEGTTKGVIHGLDPHTTPEALKANLRIRTQGVEILHARIFRNTKTAVITFFGGLTPRYVYYNGGELSLLPLQSYHSGCEQCAIK